MIEIVCSGKYAGARVRYHVAATDDAPACLVIDWAASDGGDYRVSLETAKTETAYFPACCWAPLNAEAAHKRYAAYNRGGPPERAGLTWDNREVPTWEQLQERAAAGDAGAAGVIAKWRAAENTPSIRPVVRLPVLGEGLAPPALGSECYHPKYGDGIVLASEDWAWIEEYPAPRDATGGGCQTPTLAEMGAGDACPQV